MYDKRSKDLLSSARRAPNIFLEQTTEHVIYLRNISIYCIYNVPIRVEKERESSHKKKIYHEEASHIFGFKCSDYQRCPHTDIESVCVVNWGVGRVLEAR